jgi:hypothetical protein
MQIQSGEEYHWDVPLDINASTAPYARGIYGRLFHKVKVTLEWPKFKGWLKGGKSLISETVSDKANLRSQSEVNADTVLP